MLLQQPVEQNCCHGIGEGHARQADAPHHPVFQPEAPERTNPMSEKSRRGFAAMDREKQRQIASKGGRAAHAKGSAHEFTPDQAREAGRKGGRAAHARGTAHKFTSQEAQEAGRKGGLNSHRAAAARRTDEMPLESPPSPADPSSNGNEGPVQHASEWAPERGSQSEDEIEQGRGQFEHRAELRS
jgi:general stress protein YciG